VYRLLTDPGELRKWWGPKGFTIPDIEFAPEVGRGYKIAMQPPEGDLFYLSGEFTEVEPPSLLAYTFRWHPPHPDDRDTVVALSLEDGGAETTLGLVQREFATAERYALHERGWTETLERLAQLLAR
jgi:uncharacterized protein YndB with AHSA1/START domain